MVKGRDIVRIKIRVCAMIRGGAGVKLWLEFILFTRCRDDFLNQNDAISITDDPAFAASKVARESHIRYVM